MNLIGLDIQILSGLWLGLKIFEVITERLSSKDIVYPNTKEPSMHMLCVDEIPKGSSIRFCIPIY